MSESYGVEHTVTFHHRSLAVRRQKSQRSPGHSVYTITTFANYRVIRRIKMII